MRPVTTDAKPTTANRLQERAYVAGLTAANLVLSQPGFVGQPAQILDVEPDEPHIAAGKQLFKGIRQVVNGIRLKNPFL